METAIINNRILIKELTYVSPKYVTVLGANKNWRLSETNIRGYIEQ